MRKELDCVLVSKMSEGATEIQAETQTGCRGWKKKAVQDCRYVEVVVSIAYQGRKVR